MDKIKLKGSVNSAIKYLLETQRPDGSWSGPLSSRIRETYQAYLVASMLGWTDIQETASSWLDTNEDLGVTSEERLLNQQYMYLFNGKKVDLSQPELYSDILIRKTLQVLCLAIASNSEYVLPEKFSSLENVVQLIIMKIQGNKSDIKSWAMAEFASVLMILSKKVGLSYASHFKLLTELKDQKDNWYFNPNTTLFALIAISYTNPDAQLDSYRDYIKNLKQPDGGWSFCEIPVWDTGLALQSINLIKEQSAELGSAKNRALSYLASSQNSDGGWGFIPGLESESDTSSIVSRALAEEKDESMLPSAIHYYEELQMTAGDYEGLWPVWRQTEIPSLEVVGHILTALSLVESKINVNNAVEWVLEKVGSGNVAADWGRSEPYSIYAVLNSGIEVNNTNKLIVRLLTTQNDDGGWGATSEECSNPSATANAVLSLKLVGDSIEIDAAVQKGVSYLVNSQLDNGTWPRVKEVIGSRPFVYADDCSTHNFVLQALLK